MNCPRSNSSSSGGWCSKALFRVTLLLGFIWFLWAGVLQKEAATLNGQVLVEGESMKHVEMIGKRVSNAHRNLGINLVSKRRVPNGPDPIHNRRAGNSHRPPGRA